MSEFSPGDLVRVKSGGPTMTVEQCSTRHMTGEPAVWCVWFEKTTKHNDTFPPAVLEKVERDQSGIQVGRLVRG